MIKHAEEHQNREFLTVEAFQRMLGISRAKAYETIHKPGFPVLRLGRAVRIPRQALMQWIEKQTKNNPGA
ncbi:MAG: helix-turn-helix domain-containing protein [Peptococcaceae bacterium]|nr:helix-turn-helix domain-containing protein [Peptococcaceae bacterium]